MSTSPPAVAGDVATVVVTMKGPEMGTHPLNVKMRQEEGAWKIDSIKGP